MNLKGYIFSRPFFGERAPQHIQNIVLRDYCKKKNIKLILSSTEYTVKKSTYILGEIIKKIKKYDGILFYSLLQLPEDKNKRHNVYKTIINNNKQLHFAVENIVAISREDFLNIERIFLIKCSVSVTKKKIGSLKKFITPYHKKTKRNYLERMLDNKVECMKISKKYGKDYWDGDRRFGYGGYKYIPNYFKDLAKNIIYYYDLNNQSKIIDLGCGKGFLIYEIKRILKKIKIVGLDISSYAIKNSKIEIKKNIFKYDLNKKLKFKNQEFDLVLCINTLHNLKIKKVKQCLEEINRIGKKSFVCIESFKNEKQQFNLQCWALTAETIINTSDWKWLFEYSNFSGDYEFIYFD